MRRKILSYILFIGLIGLFTGCENDGTKVVMLDDPIHPELVTTPEMTFTRANGTDILVFEGTPVNPGFDASATYVLSACVTGNNFADAVQIYSGIQDTLIRIAESDLNALLLKKIDPDVATSVDFRITASLVVDAGTGAPGTSTNPLAYSSQIVTKNVTPYGLPRLDLIGSGITQKIESALGNGVYAGFVKLDATKSFTLSDPDAGTSYGGASKTLSVDGPAITPDATGWYYMTVNTNTMSYDLTAYMIGVVGSATPNGWGAPDSKMDYDAKTGTWYSTITLADGEIKFRKNDDWGWNLGGTLSNLKHNGDNLAVTAGTYTITLTITNDITGSESGYASMVKN